MSGDTIPSCRYKEPPGSSSEINLDGVLRTLNSYGLKPVVGIAALQYYSRKHPHKEPYLRGGGLDDAISVSSSDAKNLRAWLNRYGLLSGLTGHTHLNENGEAVLEQLMLRVPLLQKDDNSAESAASALGSSASERFWTNLDEVSERYIIADTQGRRVMLKRRKGTSKIVATDGRLTFDVLSLGNGAPEITPEYLAALLKKYAHTISEKEMSVFIRANGTPYKAHRLLMSFSALLGKKEVYNSRTNEFTNEFAELLDSSETLVFGGPRIGPKNNVRKIMVDGREIERPSPDEVYEMIQKLLEEYPRISSEKESLVEKADKKKCAVHDYALKQFPEKYKDVEEIRRLAIVSGALGSILLLTKDGLTKNGEKIISGTETYGLNDGDLCFVLKVLGAKKNNGHSEA